MTDKETCDYLRIKARQLYNWRLDGVIPYIRVGRSLRYRKSAIDAALACRHDYLRFFEALRAADHAGCQDRCDSRGFAAQARNT